MVVVGAGLAGLAAATILADAGRSVLVLEASARPGGRLLGGWLAGHAIDLGAQWVDPAHVELLRLARSLGMGTESQYMRGDDLYWVDGSFVRSRHGEPPLPSGDLAALAAALSAIDERCTGQRPGLSIGPQGNSASLQDWLDSRGFGPEAAALAASLLRVAFCEEPRNVSLVAALGAMRAAGGLARATGTRGAAQDATFVVGAHQIALRLARRLGNRMRFGEPVTAIEQDASGARVVATSGIFEAVRVIVAIPPPATAAIRFAPESAAARAEVAEAMPMGSVVKFLVAYPTSFWRARGMSGQIIDPRGPVDVLLDKSMPEGLGALVGFFNGDRARAAAGLGPEGRRAVVVDAVVRSLGPAGADPIDYADRDWAEEAWVGGGYGAMWTPGATWNGDLAASVGRVHFAGSETSAMFAGYMEGAVRSGQRAAAEALSAGL